MTGKPENAGPKQAGGRFRKGASGNPAGKPKGTRHRATQMIEKIMEAGAEEITHAAIAAAKAGDMVAVRLVLERLAPAPRERHVQLDLPPMASPADAPTVALAVIEAAASGVIAPGEATALMGLLEGYRRASELADLEARIASLESISSGRGT